MQINNKHLKTLSHNNNLPDGINFHVAIVGRKSKRHMHGDKYYLNAFCSEGKQGNASFAGNTTATITTTPTEADDHYSYKINSSNNNYSSNYSSSSNNLNRNSCESNSSKCGRQSDKLHQIPGARNAAKVKESEPSKTATL